MYELKRVSEQNLCLENKVSELARAVEEWQRKDYEMKQKQHQDDIERKRRETMMQERKWNSYQEEVRKQTRRESACRELQQCVL